MGKIKQFKPSKRTVKKSVTYKKNYSLLPREPLSQKDVVQLFATLSAEKKSPIQYWAARKTKMVDTFVSTIILSLHPKDAGFSYGLIGHYSCHSS